MTRKKTRFGRSGAILECFFTYLDDEPFRLETVTVFKDLGCNLRLAAPIPDSCYDLSQEEAQRYLDDHPFRREWDLLNIASDKVHEGDLFRLEYLPELKHLLIISDRITDAGMMHLRHLKNLQRLTLWSKELTDACLENIPSQNLHSLDMNGSPAVSNAAFHSAVQSMPLLTEFWEPNGGSHAHRRDAHGNWVKRP